MSNSFVVFPAGHMFDDANSAHRLIPGLVQCRPPRQWNLAMRGDQTWLGNPRWKWRFLGKSWVYMAKSSINEGFNRKSHLSMVDFFSKPCLMTVFGANGTFGSQTSWRTTHLWDSFGKDGLCFLLVSKRFSVRFLSWDFCCHENHCQLWMNKLSAIFGRSWNPGGPGIRELQRCPKTLGGWRSCCNYMYRLCMIMLTYSLRISVGKPN